MSGQWGERQRWGERWGEMEQMVYVVPNVAIPQGSVPKQTAYVVPKQGNYAWYEQQPTPVVQGPVDSCSTPRSTEAPEEERLSASAARRLRRQRAQERSRPALPAPEQPRSLEELRLQLKAKGLECLRGEVWRLSRDDVGCRLVQEALEMGSKTAVDLAHELKGHVLEAVMCPHANYVVQKVVSHLSVASSSFIAAELQGSAVRAAKHRFACRIFCRLLEFCGTKSTRQLVDELLESPEDLCSHSFAHHVVQSILEHGEERHKKIIAEILCSDLWRYACHKNSSYLIEKALCYCSDEDQEKIISELAHPQALLDLATTPYGSFVARALLQDPRVDRTAGLAMLHARRAHVESTKHGHRFLTDVGID